MRKPIGLGIIGCGGHSARHADVVREMPENFRIVAALDINQRVADDFMGANDGLSTDNPSEFFRHKGLDAVFVGTPHAQHLKYSAHAVESGKHIMCEKPLWEGPFQQEAKDLFARCKTNGLVFSSCHPRRYEKGYVHVKNNLAEYIQRFGKVVEIRFQFFYHKPSTSWKMDDSLLLDHMNHEIDLVHFLIGYSPVSFWRLSQGFDQYSAAGRTASEVGIWFSGYRRLETRTFRNELEILFERGRVRAESVLDSPTGLVGSTVSTLSFEDDSRTTTEFHAYSYNESLVQVMENFAQAIRGDAPCYLTPQDLFMNTNACNVLVESEHGKL